MTIEVPAKKAGETLFTLHDLGFTPQINLKEEVPLGRNRGPITAEEIAMQVLMQGPAATKAITEHFAANGKPRQSAYTALNALKKKGKVKNPASGVWELSQ